MSQARFRNALEDGNEGSCLDENKIGAIEPSKIFEEPKHLWTVSVIDNNENPL